MNVNPLPAPYRADPKITSLGAQIGDPVKAADFPKAILRYRNDRWGATVGLDGLTDDAWIAHFARFKPLPDNLPEPLALRYHGHQFRTYNPDIGDGRGFLFAQLRDHEDRLLDLGTKGSGTTPYSRDGDGRLTLKGAIREILATEMLEALGVETSKTFSVIETGEELWRNDEPSPTRSAVLVRLSHSHIRIGTFQRIAYEQDAERMEALVDYVLVNLYNLKPGDNPPAQLMRAAVARVADQAAAFMAAGFVHGVLNTDNINITGESFDYGPWRFNPTWSPGFTAAYFDQTGLYSFGRQPEAMHWNLAQLAISLRVICDSPPLVEALEKFGEQFQIAFVRRFLWRLGVQSQGEDSDRALVEAAERAMIATNMPIADFFHFHRGGKSRNDSYDDRVYDVFAEMLTRYKSIESDSYWHEQLPSSMLIDEVETIWAAIAERDDWIPLQAKVEQIRRYGLALRANGSNM
ncbi:MAG: protein adenylyltransferase SelO family protein [Sphingorhabdus sp.]